MLGRFRRLLGIFGETAAKYTLWDGVARSALKFWNFSIGSVHHILQGWVWCFPMSVDDLPYRRPWERDAGYPGWVLMRSWAMQLLHQPGVYN